MLLSSPQALLNARQESSSGIGLRPADGSGGDSGGYCRGHGGSASRAVRSGGVVGAGGAVGPAVAGGQAAREAADAILRTNTYFVWAGESLIGSREAVLQEDVHPDGKAHPLPATTLYIVSRTCGVHC